MPYIRREDRERLRPLLAGLPEAIRTPGELAYVVTKLMLAYWKRRPGYATWAEIRGAVTDQIDEFRRRVIANYEETKRGENGDCF